MTCRSVVVVKLRKFFSKLLMTTSLGSHNLGWPKLRYSLDVEDGALLSDGPPEFPLRESVR